MDKANKYSNSDGYMKYTKDDMTEYDMMALLELLESIREDMEEAGVTSLAEVVQRIEELNKKLDHP